MTSKERVLTTIQHQAPDRPPVFATLTPQVAQKLSVHLNLPYEPPLDSILSSRISHMNLLTHLGNDCVGIAACTPPNFTPKRDETGVTTNEWGMKTKSFGLYNEFYEFPLAHASTIADIENYPFPDPFAAGRFDSAAATVKKYAKDYAIIGDLEISIFETAWYLVGLEKFLMDLVLDLPYVPRLLDKIMTIHVEIGKKLVELGADIIWAGDDFGTQRGMIMSPEIWRRYFKPRIHIMFQEFRKVNPDIKIAWHSCGSILPIIPDFIELGLDILNPIQPLAEGMTPEFLKTTFGAALVFFGGIDVQNLLPYGTVTEIKAEVQRIASIFGKNGGYIFAPAHNIQDDTPVENILAFFDAVKSL